MKPVSKAASAAKVCRIRNTDQNPNAVDKATMLIDKLQQGQWTSADITYRYVVSSWTGDSYDAVDLSGNRLNEVLAKLAKNY